MFNLMKRCCDVNVNKDGNQKLLLSLLGCDWFFYRWDDFMPYNVT